MNCPQCQTPLREDARFCTRCGFKSGSMPAAGPRVSAPTQPTERLESSDVSFNQSSRQTLDDPLVGHTLDAKYRLLRRLGEGGMGAVYRARRMHIGDEVAVKILHPRFVDDEASLERFRREARAAAQLHHRNVVTIHDYGEAKDETNAPAYIVMELVDGISLREVLRKKGKMPVAEAVRLMRDICAGVGAAHRREIIHRDLKPDNVIVTPDPDVEGGQTAKVVDFGIAKLRDKTSDATLTQAGMVVGTPFYMSPEQCRGETLDARSDVYSLGAMLYEMIAGHPPFVSQTVTGVVAKHLTEPPPPLPSELNVPPALQNVIMRALSKRPDERPADASAFARQIQAAMDETRLSAQPTANQTNAANTARHNVPPTNAISAELNLPSAAASGSYESAAPYRTPPTIARAPTPSPAAYQAYSANYVAPSPPSRGGWWILALGIFAIFGVTAAIVLRLLLLPPNDNANARNENRSARMTPTPQPSLKPNVTPVAPDLTPLQRAENKIITGAPLTREDLSDVPLNELRFLRNAVYARHGRIFADPNLQRYFDSRPWYKRNASYADASLTVSDKANVDLIKSIEDGSKPNASPTPSPATPAEINAARQSVADTINGWIDAARHRDVEAQMRYYADPLEAYYRKANVNVAQVRAERARVFSKYTGINLQVTNVTIELDPAVTTATVTFDKTWDFEGARNSTGSVRQELKLRKINGSWRIFYERDLKVYYSSIGENLPNSSAP